MGFLPGPGEQQPAQLLFDLMISQSRSPLLGHDHQVKGGQSGLVAAKKLPEQTPDAIALDRFSHSPGSHQPQPGMAFGHGSQGHAEMAGVEPLTLGLRPQKFLAMAEPRRLAETGGPFGVGFWTGAVHRQLASGMRLRGSPPQTDRRFRPLARRRLITARPARVLIRSKNPWVRFRRKLLG
jgi:hypothetical protein